MNDSEGQDSPQHPAPPSMTDLLDTTAPSPQAAASPEEDAAIETSATTEPTIPADTPPVVQVPVSTVAVESNATISDPHNNNTATENGGSVGVSYNDNVVAPTEGTTNGAAVVMLPRRAVSALGGSAVHAEDVEGGKQNAFLRTPPPPDAFLHSNGSTLSSASQDMMPNGNVVTPTSSADERYDVDEDDFQNGQEPMISPRSLPLGVPDPDDENDNPRDTQHSLPNPEELKLEMGVSGTQNFCLRHPQVPFIVIFGSILILIMGLSIGLTSDRRKEAKSVTFHGGDLRLHHIQEFLAVNGISDAAALDDFRTPQYQAADWLAHDDELVLGIPKLAPNENDESYEFVTRYVMAVLYYSTNGKSWRYNLSFLSDKKTCDWYQVFAPPVGQLGVLCNRNSQKIVGFSFISNNMEGPLPKELSQLTSMTYMESIGNALTGSIPDDYQKLTGLQTIVMAFNALTGKIPNWFNELPKMEFLYLSNNMLTGTIPETLAQTSTLSVLALDDNNLSGSINKIWALNNLEYLYLEDNGFTGTMPEFIETMHPLLINLDLSNNKLSGPLPVDLFRLLRIEIMDLHNNTFAGNFPNDINADQEKLRFLALHENALTGSIPATIGNLHKLTHLDLSNNQLTGRMPIEMEYLTDLTYLFLGANDFRKGKIPSWVYAMTQLKEVSLKTTQRTGTISDVVGAMDKLVLLDLDDNELTGAIPPDIGFLSNLEYLLLNRNQLSDVVPVDIKNLESLRFLLLDNNLLRGDITVMCSIDSLDLIYIDCDEIICPEGCCKCCTDGVKCHDYDQISSLDPVWEAGYERQFFDFTEAADGIFNVADDDVIADADNVP